MEMDLFVGKCINDMMQKGVTIEINKYSKHNKNKFSYFSTTKTHKKPIMRINYNNNLSDIFDTFVHEYCHYLQWKHGSKLYRNTYKSTVKFMDWLAHDIKTLSIDHIRNVQLLELDCDKRAVQLIKLHELDIDVDDYIRASNSYIISYNYVYEHRNFKMASRSLDDDIIVTMPNRHLHRNEIYKEFPEHRRLIMES